jgi:hypothetical protein
MASYHNSSSSVGRFCVLWLSCWVGSKEGFEGGSGYYLRFVSLVALKKIRVRISCLFGHSAVGSNMFCTQGYGGARYLGVNSRTFYNLYISVFGISICYKH